MAEPGLWTKLLNNHFIHLIDSSILLTNKWLQFAFTCKILLVKCFPSSKYIWELRGRNRTLFSLFFLKQEKSHRSYFNLIHLIVGKIFDKESLLTNCLYWPQFLIKRGVKVNFWVLFLQKGNLFPVLFFFISVSPSGCEYIPHHCCLYAKHRCLGLWFLILCSSMTSLALCS